MKTLIVNSLEKQYFQYREQKYREAAEERPDEALFEETLNADVVDDQYLQDVLARSVLTRFFYKVLPLPLFLTLIVYRQRHHYDAVVSWNDRFTLTYAFLLRLTRSRSHLVVLTSWMAPPKKAFVLKLLQKSIDRLILWNQTHADLLVQFSKISPERIVVIPYLVDHNFWRPMDSVVDGICSAGDSRRDYATLIEAVRGLDIHCHIATRVKLFGPDQSDYGTTSQSLAQISNFPDNVVCEPASLIEMRAMYARSRFVVVPLFPSFRDNGITILTQAMAMGKAIICSRIQGQIEFLEDGVTGISVPPGDPQALREAILYLWNHPDVAVQMGIEGRRRAEKIFALTQFVANVQQIVDDVITGKRTSIPTIAEQMWALHEFPAEESVQQVI